MNLPILNPLNAEESTYITLSKSMLDLDRALAFGTPYVFSSMIALNIPNWVQPDFFVDLNEVGITATNPNIVFPKLIQYYTENIMRQDVDNTRIAEIAFWKSLNKCGVSYDAIKQMIVFVNKITTVNFIMSENNNGWGEILCQIPNKCSVVTPSYIQTELSDVIQSTDEDGLFDNGNKQFVFTDNGAKDVFDFDHIAYDTETKSKFDFNILLLFYRDSDGVDKLHGINFIFPFENKVTYFESPRLSQKTNDARSVGYQFIFNAKTCNNEASQTLVYEQNGQSFYNTFGETLGKLNTFLEVAMKK